MNKTKVVVEENLDDKKKTKKNPEQLLAKRVGLIERVDAQATRFVGCEKYH